MPMDRVAPVLFRLEALRAFLADDEFPDAAVIRLITALIASDIIQLNFETAFLSGLCFGNFKGYRDCDFVFVVPFVFNRVLTRDIAYLRFKTDIPRCALRRIGHFNIINYQATTGTAPTLGTGLDPLEDVRAWFLIACLVEVLRHGPGIRIIDIDADALFVHVLQFSSG